MKSTRATFAVAALLAGALAALPLAHAKIPPCPGGRYLVLGDPLVGGEDTVLVDVVGMAGRMVSVASGCDAVKARVRATRVGTKVVARFASCHGVEGKALLKATISEYCRTLTGAFSIPRLRVTTPFIAALSICGDGIWDPDGGEECDGTIGPCGGLCNACTCAGVSTTTSAVTTTTGTSTSTTGIVTTTTAASTTTTTGTVTSTTAGGTTSTTSAVTTTTAGGTTSTVTTTTAGGTTSTTSAVTTTTITTTTTAPTTTTSTTTASGTTSTSTSTSTMPTTTSTTTTTTLVGADLTPTVFSCPFSVPAGAQALVDYTVKNQGTVTASAPWFDYVIFSNDATLGGDTAIGVFQRVSNLASNATYSPSQTVTFPNVPPGSYYVFFQTDGAAQVTEAIESNNVNGPVAVSITAPDLLPTAFAAPGTAAAGSMISVSYTVRNQGSATAFGPWSDQVFLSTDASFGGDTMIGSFTRATPVGINVSYSAMQSVTLPSVAPGTYYLFFRADGGDQLYEGGVDANNVRVPPLAIVIT